MAFNSVTFLFIFAPLFFLGFYLCRAPWRMALCLGFSLFFYAWGEPLFIFVAAASSPIDYWLVRVFSRTANTGTRRVLATVAITQGLLVLLYFKYAAFLYGALVSTLAFNPVAPRWTSPALPLAISFITFEKITYVVDTYRGTSPPARNLVHYLSYVFLFPKLIAGPIVKYHEIAPYLVKHRVDADDFTIGILRFALGLTKKVLIADGLAGTADTTFNTPPLMLASAGAWLGLVCFSFQIYFDFSGYSDMAIGLARMMGFHLRENFAQPYLAVNFSDFWHRWHISLSTWIRDYLYIPLGGNRVSRWRTYLNLLICFVLSGLWHGANYTFLAWGLYHGAFLVADRITASWLARSLPSVANVLLTFVLVMFGWVLFRAPTIEHALGFMRALFDPGRDVPPVVFLDQNLAVTLVAAAIMSFVPEQWLRVSVDSAPVVARNAALCTLISVAFIWTCCRVVAATFTPFLYFRF